MDAEMGHVAPLYLTENRVGQHFIWGLVGGQQAKDDIGNDEGDDCIPNCREAVDQDGSPASLLEAFDAELETDTDEGQSKEPGA